MLRMQSSMIRAIMFTAMPERRVRLFNSVVCEPQVFISEGTCVFNNFEITIKNECQPVIDYLHWTQSQHSTCKNCILFQQEGKAVSSAFSNLSKCSL